MKLYPLKVRLRISEVIQMNEEKSSADIYWEKVSDMIEEAESKYKKTGIVYDAESVLSDLKEKYNFKS